MVQKQWGKPTQDICLTGDDFIEITQKRLLSECSFKFDLREFDPHSSRQKSTPLRPVRLAILFAVLFAITLVVWFNESATSQQPLDAEALVALTLWGSLMLITALCAWFGRSDLVAYFNRFSGGAVLTLYHGRPDAATFDEFVSAVDARLQAINSRSARPKAAGRLGADDFFSLN